MPQLSDHLNATFDAARGAIFGDCADWKKLTILGGEEIDGIPAETTTGENFDSLAVRKEARLTIVCKTSEFDLNYTLAPEDYAKEAATWDGAAWRVESIEHGEAAVTVHLIHPEQA